MFTTHRKLLLVGLLILLVAFVFTFPLYGGARTRILTTMLMYAILAVSWAMFSGATGYMSLAPAAFLGMGVYSTALLQDYLPFPVLIVVGGLISFVLALLLGLVTLRLKGIYFTIFSFGLVVLMADVINYIEAEALGRHGWYFIYMDRATLLYTMFGLAVVTVLAAYFISRSRLGLAMRSIGGNEEAAEHMGINTTRIKVLTFAISSIFMGAAGVVLAPSLTYSNASIAFSVTNSFIPIVAAVFGGMGTLYGPMIGANVFGFLEKTLRAEWNTYFMLGFGVIMVVVIMFLPNGLAGLVPMLRDKLGGVISRLQRGSEGEQHADT
ncbi:MAG: branched-chain amino acid ABC transporter permease [Dehalococcoidia bacterium]|nr:MAG: branched-chain amino acid ABC transporter permease [Dehalococcoidia bacterium]